MRMNVVEEFEIVEACRQEGTIGGADDSGPQTSNGISAFSPCV